MGGEWQLAEKPCIEGLEALGYMRVRPKQHEELRDGENQVLFRSHLIEAIQRINGIGEEDARAAYADLLSKSDNEEWTQILRGNYSRTVSGQATKQTIRVIDFLNPENNTFVVTNQLYVKSQKPRIPDVVVYVNGIPLVVIEAKSPLNFKDKTGEAFEQIKQYERDIPRLFYANAFNILTDGTNCIHRLGSGRRRLSLVLFLGAGRDSEEGEGEEEGCGFHGGGSLLARLSGTS